MITTNGKKLLFTINFKEMIKMTMYHSQEFEFNGNEWKVYFWDIDALEIYIKKGLYYKPLNEGEGVDPELVDDYLFIRENFFEKFFNRETYQ